MNNLTVEDIHSIVLNNNFLFYYQPIMDNKSLKITSAEALVRFKDKDGRIHSPSGLIERIESDEVQKHLVLQAINSVINTLRKTDINISMNLTCRDIEDKYISKTIYNILENNIDISHRIIFEVTESEMISNYKSAINFIKTVKEFKCKIAIDDFGTGYSNYSNLTLDVDYVKIDGEIIKDIEFNNKKLNILISVVGLLKKLGIYSVAEYVYNKRIFEIVRSIGVDYSQGFYISKPLESL